MYYFYPEKSFSQIQHVLTKAADAIKVMVVENGKFREAESLNDIDISWIANKRQRT